MSEEIFALDIGTRKVMGIVALRRQTGIEIVDVETIEHQNRPMFDGQIHSIEEVAQVVLQVKTRLEKRLNVTLSRVGVAVAGRNLLTFQRKVVKTLESETQISAAMIRDLELEAVDAIVSESPKNLAQFYCVGYSPVYYELDQTKISNLLGHKGQSIATEVIATFLPRVVLDSLLTVLDMSGLQATNITLEPIAAINAIIPSEMRKLNLILVDIGAGTSDLALTKDGFVYAYGMVPEAGDEITERVSEVLLVDFPTAEKIKRLLTVKKEITYGDILGKTHRVDVTQVRQGCIDAVEHLAKDIAHAGLSLNGGLPHAVVAVGGGSLTPGLIQALAEAFGLPEDKVGIRFPNVIAGIKDSTDQLIGPEAVTPIGIMLMTMRAQGLRFVTFTVNGTRVRMLDLLQKKDIMGALTLSGILQNKKLHSRLGLALTIEINGQIRAIKGTLGRPANIILNGKPVSSLSERIEDNDVIVFEEAIDGKDASAKIKDLFDLAALSVVLNGEIIKVLPPVLMNGVKAAQETWVTDLAKIETRPPRVKDVLEDNGIELDKLQERQILVNINRTPRILTQRNFTLMLNGNLADLNETIEEKDTIEFKMDTPTSYRIKDVIDMASRSSAMHINVDGQDVEIFIEPLKVLMNGHQVSTEEFLIDGAEIEVYYVKRQIMLSEIFKYIEFDPYRGIGKNFKIFVNDKPAGFTTPLTDGSRVQIVFEART